MIAAIRQWWEWNTWLFRLAWLSATDRWFIFRDAPLHVVARFAAFEDDEDPDFQRMVDGAREELRLRVRHLERDIRAALLDSLKESACNVSANRS